MGLRLAGVPYRDGGVNAAMKSLIDAKAPEEVGAK
jgi:hypothetical protein